MVLTVTLNPLLERRILLQEIHYGRENRGGKITIRTGGKGINVSRQLNYLNIDNTALTFAGGITGKLFKETLYREKIKPVIIRTESETREALIMQDDSSGKLTTCIGENQVITPAEAKEFWEKLEKMIPNFEIIAFSGSSPSKETDFIFPQAIELANKLDKVSVCDTYGEHLDNCINAAPIVLHNNLNETGIKSSEKEIIEYLSALYEKGIKQAFLTDGGSSFYASNFDFHYKADFPKAEEKDATGSGDAFTAGVIYGWDQDLVFEDTLKHAAALGTANALSFNTCAVTKEEFSNYINTITITPVGKRMKHLDVTPK